ncbi:hypothetical protein [Spirochaeta cellobiosiphila]|uniref:hypothetical protein n=1 Tax=Spirochaeta cellobiosiphila TaxID=504483 RepID=UPI000425C9B5|nr:hypothetical protein [Spirochaeta cellobiosiphila]
MAESIIKLPSNNIAINDFGNPNGKVILINHGMIASIKDEKLFQKIIDNEFRIKEEGNHFSKEILDKFIDEIVIQEENRGDA